MYHRFNENIDVEIPERGVFDEEEELEVSEADVQGVFDALDDVYEFIGELEEDDAAKELLDLVQTLDTRLTDLFQLEEEVEEEDEDDEEEDDDEIEEAYNRYVEKITSKGHVQGGSADNVVKGCSSCRKGGDHGGTPATARKKQQAAWATGNKLGLTSTKKKTAEWRRYYKSQRKKNK